MREQEGNLQHNSIKYEEIPCKVTTFFPFCYLFGLMCDANTTMKQIKKNDCFVLPWDIAECEPNRLRVAN